MSRSMIRLAALSAGLVLAPVFTASVSADTPAPPPPVREGRPADAPPGRPPEGRPGEGRPGEGRPGEGRPGAEGRPAARLDPMMMIERVQSVLNGMDLSAEQKTKIDEAVAAAKKSIEGQKETEPRERMQASMETMGKLRTDIESTLNDEQRKVFAEKVPPRGAPGQGRPGEGRPGQPGEPRPAAPGAPGAERGAMLQNALNAALEKTDLTAEQKAKVKENFMAEIQKMMRDGGGQRPGARPEGRPEGRPQGGPEGRPQGGPPEGAPQRPNRPAQEI